MTREELKAHCEKQVRACEMWASSQGEKPCGKIYEEHKLILELLEQEPTTKNDLGVDAISRKQAIEEADKLCLETGYDNEKVIEMLNELPSVTPIRPKGHWIPVRVDRYSEQYGHFKINEYKCSNCNSEFEYGYHNYCPYCGAKMIEPQGREDKG